MYFQLRRFRSAASRKAASIQAHGYSSAAAISRSPMIGVIVPMFSS